MLAFNMAQVCMASGNNVTKLNTFPSIDYTPREVSYINWAVGFGTISATFPFSSFYNKYGAKWPFFTAGILSALATAFMPQAAEYHIYVLLALRFVQGIAYAADFAAVGVLCSKWASLKQNGLFISVLTFYSPLSSFFTNSFGGMICDSSFGWPMVFYSHAIAGLVVFTLWVVFYKDRPQRSPRVSDIELEKIQRDKSDAQIAGGHEIPYRALLTDPVIIIVWLNAFTDIFSANFLAIYSPYYIRNVLHYSIKKTGHFAAISRVIQIPFRLLCGYLSDKIKFIPENTKLIVFNTIAVAFAGIFYLLVGLVPADAPIWGIVLFAMINLVIGAAPGGFYKCGVLHGRQYSHFIIANCQFIKCITLFLGPAMVAFFVKDESNAGQWFNIFLITGISLISSHLLFCKFATVEPAYYTLEAHELPKKEQILTKDLEKVMSQDVITPKHDDTDRNSDSGISSSDIDEAKVEKARKN
ncbi:unnamed protein product [Bursaphelenchus okinawaensis]|uniref:Major facilitator superfamily (MFS) profile domain-containing protein n=1 Tax=Bursaphelenchus okinawaensis TaxID=465554 RepID=A0A811L0V6_9BILA|nr:unnamed protein product [Bursaphelenchus okinawaensis]CAG9114489.1 unnamed protein product [Bursaphelenchus okinawaensis]